MDFYMVVVFATQVQCQLLFRLDRETSTELLEQRGANHIEFCRIKIVLDEILQMHRTSELNEILKLLIDRTWVATGLKVAECEAASVKIGEIISLDDESDQKFSSFSAIPKEFFEDMEYSWKGLVKRIHIDNVLIEVERAAEALSLAVGLYFVTLVATSAPLGGPKGEILYAREHEAVWFKGKRFAPTVWAGTPGEEKVKQLKSAIDSKGNDKVNLFRYHEAGAKAKAKVLEILRGLSAELQSKLDMLVFASTLLVIAKALFSHVSEGRRRKWVFPTLAKSHGFKDVKPLDETNKMKIDGLLPYWFNVAEGGAVHNAVDMQSLFLLTGPNGGGKSSLLHSICAAALLGICRLMVPAALIPYFDSVMLHMKSYDSPAVGKSSFQVEMSELRSMIAATTKRSLLLVDEICRGTETAKGTCIAGRIIETLDSIGCLGIVSTHLHGIFDLPLNPKNTVYKAIGTVCIDGQTKVAFETAKREGIPETIIQRTEHLYLSVYTKGPVSGKNCSQQEYSSCTNVDNSNGFHLQNTRVKRQAANDSIARADRMEVLHKKVESAITLICQENTSELLEIKCVLSGGKEQPPPSTIGASSVYVILRPDKKLYVGQTDDLEDRIHAHRSKEGMQSASFIYFLVPGKSMAFQLETLLNNQLPSHGFQLTNVADEG
ncbi:hypothetical protein L6164_012990 [Bauhinia variegata]|uniref:Uncharacterized protein n=1 Tax=Bauhinia variegata TaxID=167791 RepID=A0ACB9PDA1_BAUVA|nr:hypothetical protein L6164_012990 [Bauhinia variegata]